ncbi:MAG: hypothetical protein IVW54_04490 [Candidatus Binataceae bacterium]|nr:hypothetical protein [Candidatus Binataceae bacterium]
MDQSKLRQRIGTRADLIIGDAKENLAALNFDGRPLGAVMFDLDYYTSTRDALPVLTGNHTLPRMWCYLDDIDGYPENCYVDAIGVRAAVSDFNRQSSDNQVSRVYCFQGLAPEEWHARIYACHRLAHPDYNRCPERGKHQLPLE